MSDIYRLLLRETGEASWAPTGPWPIGNNAAPQTSGTEWPERCTGIHLIVDSLPTIHCEAFPWPGISAWRRLLASRLERLFPHTPWRDARVLDLFPGRRLQVAFLGLSGSAVLENALRQMDQRGIEVHGIHTTSTLLPALLPPRPFRRHFAIASRHGQSLRLTRYVDSCPLHSRQTVLPPPVELPRTLADFLSGTSANVRKDAPWWLIGDRAWLQTLPRLPGSRCVPIGDCDDVSRELLRLPSWRWPRRQFAPATQRRALIQALTRRRYRLASAAIALCALTWSAHDIRRMAATDRQIEQLRESLRQLEAERHRLEDRFRARGLDPAQTGWLEEMPALAEAGEAYPAALYRLATAMDATPQIHINLLDWKIPSDTQWTATRWQMHLAGEISTGDESEAVPLEHFLEQLTVAGLSPVKVASPEAQADGRFTVDMGGGQ